MIGEIHQQDRILDLDADEGHETDRGHEGKRVAGKPETDQAADEAEGNHRRDDRRAAEAAELEHQDRHDPEGRDHDRAGEATETFFAALDLAAKRPAGAGGPLEVAQGRGGELGEGVDIVTVAHERRDGRRAFAVEPLDDRRRAFEPQLGYLRDRQVRPRHRALHFDLRPVFQRGPLATRQRQLDDPLITVTLAKSSDLQPGKREADGPVDLQLAHAEGGGHGFVDHDPQVGAPGAHGIADGLRAFDPTEQRLDPRRERRQLIQVLGENPHRDRCLDRRAVLELLHHDPGSGNRRQLRAQILEHRGRLFRIIFVQGRKDIRDARLRSLRTFVVVNLRVVVADGGEVARHRRRRREHGLHLPRHGIRRRNTRAVLRLDLDQELRHAGLRKKRESNARHERQAAGDEGGRHHEGPDPVLHAPMEERPVAPFDPAMQAAQQEIALRVLVAAQHQARQQRDDRQRHEQRREHGIDDGQRQAADELPGATRQHEQREKCKQQRPRRAQHRHRNLLRALHRGGHRTVSHPPEARDVLHHDDRVVHQEAESDHTADDAQLVQAVAKRGQHRDADRERKRDRDDDEHRGPQPERQHRDQHEGEGDEEVVLEAAQPQLDVGRLVPADFQPHVTRQRRLETRDLLPQGPAEFEQVLRGPRADRHEYGAFAIVPAEVLLVGRGPGDLRHVLQVHDRRPGRQQRRHAHVVEARVAATRLDVETTIADIDGSARETGVVALDRRDDLRQRKTLLRDPVEIERHPELLFRIRVLAGLPDARHRLGALPQRLRQLLQPRVARIGRHERDLHHRDVDRLELSHVDLDHAGRQPRSLHVYLPEHVVVLLFRIGPVGEVDADVRIAVAHGGTDLVDVVEFLDRIL